MGGDMSTITAGNTVSTAITITGDTTGNLTLSANATGSVILTSPLQFVDGTTQDTAAAVSGGLNVTLQQSYGGF
jgi:hypothetical protein